MSQSLHFFRAFQLYASLQAKFLVLSRNPFNFSGHFNKKGKRGKEKRGKVAIPSTFQGIST